MANETVVKFGYPASLLKEYGHWVVLLRPQQATLGCMVLASKSEETQFSAIDGEAFEELAKVTGDIERVLTDAFQYDKINYLMLMMVDPHVHFHVVPRFSAPRSISGMEFVDNAWPKPPNLGESTDISDVVRAQIMSTLRRGFAEYA